MKRMCRASWFFLFFRPIIGKAAQLAAEPSCGVAGSSFVRTRLDAMWKLATEQGGFVNARRKHSGFDSCSSEHVDGHMLGANGSAPPVVLRFS